MRQHRNFIDITTSIAQVGSFMTMTDEAHMADPHGSIIAIPRHKYQSSLLSPPPMQGG